MFEALRELAETLGVDPAGRPWKEVMPEILEAVGSLKSSYDYLNEMVYGGYDDYPEEYDREPDYGYDQDQDYWYDEGLDYIQGSDY